MKAEKKLNKKLLNQAALILGVFLLMPMTVSAQSNGQVSVNVQVSVNAKIPAAQFKTGLEDIESEGTETKVEKPNYSTDSQTDDDAAQLEGTQSRFSPEALASIAPWIHNTKVGLDDLVYDIKSLRPAEAVTTMLERMHQIVKTSYPKRTELFVRYTLNRARISVEELRACGDSPDVLAQQMRILKHSVYLAREYYNNDIDTLTAIANGDTNAGIIPTNFAAYGLRYAKFLMYMEKSITCSRAQYNIGINAMGYLGNDLLSGTDQGDKVKFGPAIGHLADFLSTMPAYSHANVKENFWNYQLTLKTFIRVQQILSQEGLSMDDDNYSKDSQFQ